MEDGDDRPHMYTAHIHTEGNQVVKRISLLVMKINVPLYKV